MSENNVTSDGKPLINGPDPIIPEGQVYVCMSFARDPKNIKTIKGIKIRGAFATKEEADKHIEQLSGIDSYTIYTGRMGYWHPFDPDPDSKCAEDVVYANEQLNDIMVARLREQNRSKLFFERNKYMNLVNAGVENISNREKQKKELLDELNKNNSSERFNSISDRILRIDQDIKKTREEMEEKQKKIEEITNELGDDLSKVKVDQQVTIENGSVTLDDISDEMLVE